MPPAECALASARNRPNSSALLTYCALPWYLCCFACRLVVYAWIYGLPIVRRLRSLLHDMRK